MADDFLDYPKGRWAVGPGDLLDVYDVNVQYTDGEKTVPTLRRNPGGSTGGPRFVKATFKCAISQNGYERDFMGYYRKRTVVQGRLKVPGLTHNITGRYTEPKVMTNTDSFVEFEISVIGKGTESKV
jgi:hypothetical protein